MREFRLDVSTCLSSSDLDELGVNITTSHNDYCLNKSINFKKHDKTQRSDWFECLRPMISFKDIKLKSRQKTVCIKAIGLEATNSKFLREGLDIKIPANMWSESVQLYKHGSI